LAPFICRGKSRGKASCNTGGWTNEIDSQPSGAAAAAGAINKESGSRKVGKNESEGAVVTLKDRLKWAEKHVVRKVVSFLLLLEILVKLFKKCSSPELICSFHTVIIKCLLFLSLLFLLLFKRNDICTTNLGQLSISYSHYVLSLSLSLSL
jgi:hypothetical protein